MYRLELKGIEKSFPGVKALDGVNLSVKPGSIHALMGENGAGKSTIMKCLFGIYTMDAGEVFFNGEKVEFSDPKHALENGVSMVHQELIQVNSMTVLENIWLGKYLTKNGFLDQKEMYKQTKTLLKSLEIDIDPNEKVGDLSVSQKQMVEIAKAVSYDAQVIILDEPTSSLTDKEVGHLFSIMRNLKEKGVSMVFISHKMEEITEICDEITILRDGQYVGTKLIKDTSMAEIIKMMVGRDLGKRFPDKTEHKLSKEVMVEMKNISTTFDPQLKNVNFELRKGEILGVSGLVGCGRTELAETLFGIRTIEEGEIIIHGEKVTKLTPRKAVKDFQMAYVTEERRETGIFDMSDITFNTTIANTAKYLNKFGFLSDKELIKDTEKQIKDMRIKTPSTETLIRSLSGGNQQKVIIGRWLVTEPDIFILDEPTRGIDVGAKYEIYELILRLRDMGKTVLMISSEMPELIGVTDRIMVMSNYQVAGIVETKNTTQEELMTLAVKYL